MKYSEIAQLLSEKEITVRVRYKRAITRLKAMTETRDDLKLRSVSLPLIIVALKTCRNLPQYQLTQVLSESILSNLHITNKIMEEAVKDSSTAPSEVVSSPAKELGALSKPLSTKALIAVSTVGVAVIAGVVGTIIFIQNKDDKKEDTKVTTTTVVGVTTTTLAEDVYEGWKTYTDPENIYQISVPETWGVSSDFEKGKYSEAGKISYTKIVNIDGTDNLNSLLITKLDSYFDNSYLDCTRENDVNFTYTKIDNILIGGVDTYSAYKTTSDTGDPDSGEFTGDKNNQYLYCVKTPEGRYLEFNFEIIQGHNESEVRKAIASVKFLVEGDPYAGWKTYEYSYKKQFPGGQTDETIKVQFNYPDGWLVAESEDENSDYLEVSDGQNKIKLHPIYDDGTNCVFGDDPNYEEDKDFPLNIGIEKYYEFTNGERKYRRNTEIEKKLEIVICNESSDGAFTTFIPDFNMDIYYFLTESSDSDTLNTLDKIVLSVEKM